MIDRVTIVMHAVAFGVVWPVVMLGVIITLKPSSRVSFFASPFESIGMAVVAGLFVGAISLAAEGVQG